MSRKDIRLKRHSGIPILCKSISNNPNFFLNFSCLDEPTDLANLITNKVFSHHTIKSSNNQASFHVLQRRFMKVFCRVRL